MPDPSTDALARGLRYDSAKQLKTALDNRAPIHVDEFTNPVAADVDILAAAAATVTTTSTVTSFLAGGVAALAAYPRTVTLSTAGGTAADAPATAVLTGTDVDGNVQTETVNVAQTAATVTSAKLYKTLVSVAYAAGDGTDATVSIGIGVELGFSKKPKVRAGAVSVINENAVGVRVTTGTFTIPTTDPPYGSYTPSSAADGTRDYAIAYELDLG